MNVTGTLSLDKLLEAKSDPQTRMRGAKTCVFMPRESLSRLSRMRIHIDGLPALFACVKRLFGFKFPVAAR